MRRPSGLEWVAWALVIGARQIDAEAAKHGLGVRSPLELRQLADAFVALARSEPDFRTLPEVEKPADTDTGDLVHIEEVADMVGRSRRWVDDKCRGLPVDKVKHKGRTYIRREEVERLRP